MCVWLRERVAACACACACVCVSGWHPSSSPPHHLGSAKCARVRERSFADLKNKLVWKGRRMDGQMDG